MNIAIGKIGGAAYFNQLKWANPNGKHELIKTIQFLANNNPNDKFFIISRTDLTPEYYRKYFKYNNVEYIYFYKKNKISDKDFIIEFFNKNNIKIDTGLFILGPHSSINIENKVFKKDSNEYIKPLQMFGNYAGPIFNFLNETMIPWFGIWTDERYNIQAKDLLNPPLLVFAQSENMVLKYSHFVSFNDNKHLLIEKEYNVERIPIEAYYNFANKKIQPKQYKKEFIFKLLSSYGSRPIRLKIMKEFTKNIQFDFQVIGNWQNSIFENDKRFVGTINYNKIKNEFKNTKYTIIDSPSKRFKWSTPKFWEMLESGAVVFINNINSKFLLPDGYPEFLIINNYKDLNERILFLENNELEYKKIVDTLYSFILKDYTNDKIISDLIMTKIKENLKIFK